MQCRLLHHKLKEELENSKGRVRYIESELYLKSNERSPAIGRSEVQSTTLNIGDNIYKSEHTNKTVPVTSPARREAEQGERNHDIDCARDSNEGDCSKPQVNKNCQVCLIKEVRIGLMNMNKMVQERNERIKRIKAKCLRSYLERQVLE